MKRTAPLLGTLATAAALVLSACSSGGSSGSSGGGGSPAAAGNPATGSSGGSVTISMSSGHLVGPDGRTLYSNSADSATHLICTGSCLNIWPPVLGKAVAGHGVASGALGTIKRGSTIQVTYQGHPVYEFSSDTKAGDTKGDGISDAGGIWHPAGSATPTGGASSASNGGSGGGYGYP